MKGKKEDGGLIAEMNAVLPPHIFIPLKSFPPYDGSINALINCLIRPTGQISPWKFTEWRIVCVIK